MKIIFINNLYSPYAVGGAERIIEKRAREAVDRGDEAILITSAPWRGWGSWCPQKGIEDDILLYRFWVPNICFYKNLNKHNFFFKLLWHIIDLFNFWSGRIVQNILEIEKPDIVEMHNLMGIGYSFKVLKSKIKTILYLHDVQLVEPSGVLMWNHDKDNLGQKIYSWIMKKKFKDITEVISPTEFLRDFYQSRGFFRNADFKINIAKSKFQITNKLQNSNPKFLFVGSLVEHKGVRILMEAWEQIHHYETPRSAQDDIKLHIVGDGILLQEVKGWAKNYPEVVVHGRLEEEKLEKIYKQCYVLIFPSICLENNPTVIHEALHHGLHVIASHTGGVGEIFAGIENINLIEPDNISELVDAVKEIKINF